MLALGLGAGLLLQWLVLLAARRAGVLATPNERSSHQVPTPAGGGLGIMLLVLGYVFYVALWDIIPADNPLMATGPSNLAWWWLLGIGALTVVGGWDDLYELGPWVRLFAQVAAVALVLWGLQLPVAVWLTVLLLVALLWFVNLFNFMDGIDGIAAAQVLVFCLGAQILSGGVPGWSAQLVWLLTGATLAFLAFNWPPAKIFMGDVGSLPLGLLIGGLVLYLWQQDLVPLVGSLILLAGFWFDATYTLCVRMFSGQAYIQAHRTHLYQRIARRRGHLWTTMAYLIFSAAWLLPLAYTASHANNPDMTSYQVLTLFGANPAAWWWLLLAVAPLAALCVYFKAGQPE